MQANATKITIRSCKPVELPLVVNKLDDEFVFKKGRSISLKERFPKTLSEANIDQIRVALLDGGVCGVLAIRMFDWIVGKTIWRGAMVGMVWVDPGLRGQGVGSSLLSSTTEFLRTKNIDFGVLWTSVGFFYERAGWCLSDIGIFGEASTCPCAVSNDAVLCRPLPSVDPVWLEHLRSILLDMRVSRNSLDYRALPIPAVNVWCFSAEHDDGSAGFALVGEYDRTGYLYEMVAPSHLWPTIWGGVQKRFSRLFVNGNSYDPFSLWLAGKGYVTWRPQEKTMWLRMSSRIQDVSVPTWHISYFDWI